MQHVLSALEARVIGSLIEKELTTPDQYPLTLNALVAACNQKSNREPLLELSANEVQATVDALLKARLVSDRGNLGGRVTRYRQRFVNGEFGGLKFGPGETAIVCELLLRGPQTPGELRAHCQRMHAFADAQAVENALEELMTRPDGPFVQRLARAPGAREPRYVQLFCGPVEEASLPTPAASAPRAADEGARLAALEEEVRALTARLAALEARLGEA